MRRLKAEKVLCCGMEQHFDDRSFAIRLLADVAVSIISSLAD